MDQDSVHMVAASKVPMLKPGEYKLWRMRMEEYIQMIDYSLWEVIENGLFLHAFLDHLCHHAILCLDQHAHTSHLFESLLTISFDRLDILKEDLVYQSLWKSLSLILKLS
ncbi:hypothetical protein Tco_0572647 [Tanacetum coccineum]